MNCFTLLLFHLFHVGVCLRGDKKGHILISVPIDDPLPPAPQSTNSTAHSNSTSEHAISRLQKLDKFLSGHSDILTRLSEGKGLESDVAITKKLGRKMMSLIQEGAAKKFFVTLPFNFYLHNRIKDAGRYFLSKTFFKGQCITEECQYELFREIRDLSRDVKKILREYEALDADIIHTNLTAISPVKAAVDYLSDKLGIEKGASSGLIPEMKDLLTAGVAMSKQMRGLAVSDFDNVKNMKASMAKNMEKVIKKVDDKMAVILYMATFLANQMSDEQYKQAIAQHADVRSTVNMLSRATMTQQMQEASSVRALQNRVNKTESVLNKDLKKNENQMQYVEKMLSDVNDDSKKRIMDIENDEKEAMQNTDQGIQQQLQIGIDDKQAQEEALLQGSAHQFLNNIDSLVKEYEAEAMKVESSESKELAAGISEGEEATEEAEGDTHIVHRALNNGLAAMETGAQKAQSLSSSILTFGKGAIDAVGEKLDAVKTEVGQMLVGDASSLDSGSREVSALSTDASGKLQSDLSNEVEGASSELSNIDAVSAGEILDLEQSLKELVSNAKADADTHNGQQSGEVNDFLNKVELMESTAMKNVEVKVNSAKASENMVYDSLKGSVDSLDSSVADIQHADQEELQGISKAVKDSQHSVQSDLDKDIVDDVAHAGQQSAALDNSIHTQTAVADSAISHSLDSVHDTKQGLHTAQADLDALSEKVEQTASHNAGKLKKLFDNELALEAKIKSGGSLLTSMTAGGMAAAVGDMEKDLQQDLMKGEGDTHTRATHMLADLQSTEKKTTDQTNKLTVDSQILDGDVKKLMDEMNLIDANGQVDMEKLRAKVEELLSGLRVKGLARLQEVTTRGMKDWDVAKEESVNLIETEGSGLSATRDLHASTAADLLDHMNTRERDLDSMMEGLGSEVKADVKRFLGEAAQYRNRMRSLDAELGEHSGLASSAMHALGQTFDEIVSKRIQEAQKTNSSLNLYIEDIDEEMGRILGDMQEDFNKSLSVMESHIEQFSNIIHKDSEEEQHARIAVFEEESKKAVDTIHEASKDEASLEAAIAEANMNAELEAGGLGKEVEGLFGDLSAVEGSANKYKVVVGDEVFHLANETATNFEKLKELLGSDIEALRAMGMADLDTERDEIKVFREKEEAEVGKYNGMLQSAYGTMEGDKKSLEELLQSSAEKEEGMYTEVEQLNKLTGIDIQALTHAAMADTANLAEEAQNENFAFLNNTANFKTVMVAFVSNMENFIEYATNEMKEVNNMMQFLHMKAEAQASMVTGHAEELAEYAAGNSSISTDDAMKDVAAHQPFKEELKDEVMESLDSLDHIAQSRIKMTQRVELAARKQDHVSHEKGMDIMKELQTWMATRELHYEQELMDIQAWQMKHRAKASFDLTGFSLGGSNPLKYHADGGIDYNSLLPPNWVNIAEKKSGKKDAMPTKSRVGKAARLLKNLKNLS